MADYKKAIAEILKVEGGYANDPDDNGGETFKGISRKFWPSWDGWEIIDKAKKLPDFPKSLNRLVFLNDLVILFYKQNFWDKIVGNNIKDQAIAEIIVDSAVNEGIKPAIKRAEGIVGMPLTGKISEELLIKLNSMS